MPRRNRRPGWGHEPGARWRLGAEGRWVIDLRPLPMPTPPRVDQVRTYRGKQ